MRRTLVWVWGMIWNPPLIWEHPDGTFCHTEKVNRFRGHCTRWDLRPMWFHTILTTRQACGCRRRLGLKHTIICGDCAGFNLDGAV